MSKETIQTFYQSFQNHDPKGMIECYHEKVIFNDPVFRNLDCTETGAMWSMLIERADGNLKINFHDILADDSFGQCTWEAIYPFSKTGNEVHNVIHASMEFEDGLIIKHTDFFNFWRWSRMALGTPGTLLGWTPILKNKVRQMASKSLKNYLEKH